MDTLKMITFKSNFVIIWIIVWGSNSKNNFITSGNNKTTKKLSNEAAGAAKTNIKKWVESKHWKSLRFRVILE